VPSFKFDMSIDVNLSTSSSALEFCSRKLVKLEIVLEVSDVRVGRGGGGTACLEEDELAEAEVATELRFEEVPSEAFSNSSRLGSFGISGALCVCDIHVSKSGASGQSTSSSSFV